MAPAKKSAVSSTLTIENFVSASKRELRAAEGRTDGWEWMEFICKFRDRTGIVTGGYLKKTGRLLALVIFGKGPTWSTVVSTATSLATQDETTARNILLQLGAFKARGEKKIIEESGNSFQIFRFGDGQLLFRIIPAQNPQPAKQRVAAARTRQVAVAVGRVSAAGNSHIKHPSLGRDFAAFKKHFDKWVRSNASQSGVEEGEQHSQRDAWRVSFGNDTCLVAFAADGKTVSQLLLDGITKESAEFWFCLEATIAALNPRMSETGRQDVMNELGRTKKASLPKNEAEFDDGKARYTYARNGNRCVLQIWPSRESTG